MGAWMMGRRTPSRLSADMAGTWKGEDESESYDRDGE
jgi:hypothetical protein